MQQIHMHHTDTHIRHMTHTHTHTNVFQGVSDNGSRNEGNLKVLEEVRRLPERADPADLWDLAQ
jgi:hypothetical protein